VTIDYCDVTSPYIYNDFYVIRVGDMVEAGFVVVKRWTETGVVVVDVTTLRTRSTAVVTPDKHARHRP